MTLASFYTNICGFSDAKEDRDLEVYLSALYKLVLENQHLEPSFDLFYSLLRKSFTAPFIEFNDDWLAITDPPDENILYHKFTNPLVADSVDKSFRSNVAGFDYLIAVLQFQISELHKMRDKQLKDEYRYFGIDSEAGNRWYNFDPCTNLECGVSCMLESMKEDTEPFTVSWQTLGEIIEKGRIYE